MGSDVKLLCRARPTVCVVTAARLPGADKIPRNYIFKKKNISDVTKAQKHISSDTEQQFKAAAANRRLNKLFSGLLLVSDLGGAAPPCRSGCSSLTEVVPLHALCV